MDTNEKKIKTSKRNSILALALLLLTNVLLSIVLTGMFKHVLREQINQRMLDIANTAAYMLDGDELGTLTAEDEGTEPYNRALETLRAFQDNIQLDYIYGIRDMGDGTFTFTIDPAEEDPGEFGALIETTDALVKASQGTPGVDIESYSDEWGRFYSAYSPVYDSNGNITGIVGVDFDAEWYDGKLNSNRLIAFIITSVALLIGLCVSFAIMTQNKRRFADTMKTIGELDEATQRLDKTIIQTYEKKLHSDEKNAALKAITEEHGTKYFVNNEYEELSHSLTAIYSKLKNYVEYIDSEIYTDPITNVGNKAAYTLHIEKLDQEIKAGTAQFSVAFFDINGLKKIYTNYGYEAGDKLMFECAKLIKKFFGNYGIYHITGDEFIVITDNGSLLDLEILLAKLDNEIRRYNTEHTEEEKLSVAKGAAVYKPNRSRDYRHVFIEAKDACDKDKAEYYERKNKNKNK